MIAPRRAGAAADHRPLRGRRRRPRGREPRPGRSVPPGCRPRQPERRTGCPISRSSTAICTSGIPGALRYPWLADLPKINPPHGVADLHAAAGPVTGGQGGLRPGRGRSAAGLRRGRLGRRAGGGAQVPSPAHRRLGTPGEGRRRARRPGPAEAARPPARHPPDHPVSSRTWSSACGPGSSRACGRWPTTASPSTSASTAGTWRTPSPSPGSARPCRWCSTTSASRTSPAARSSRGAARSKDLAAMDHVVCKISGVATEADHDDWTRDPAAPLYRRRGRRVRHRPPDVRRRLAGGEAGDRLSRVGGDGRLGLRGRVGGRDAEALPRHRDRLLSGWTERRSRPGSPAGSGTKAAAAVITATWRPSSNRCQPGDDPGHQGGGPSRPARDPSPGGRSPGAGAQSRIGGPSLGCRSSQPVSRGDDRPNAAAASSRNGTVGTSGSTVPARPQPVAAKPATSQRQAPGRGAVAGKRTSSPDLRSVRREHGRRWPAPARRSRPAGSHRARAGTPRAPRPGAPSIGSRASARRNRRRAESSRPAVPAPPARGPRRRE